MKYIDMFGGIGGFSLGIKRATNKDSRKCQSEPERSKRSSIQRSGNCSDNISRRGKSKSKEGHRIQFWECVGYYDNDKYAVQTYNKNFKTNYKPTDITTVKEADIPDHDLICAGFPCQAFSIAGKRRGFEDTRGTLFFEIMRIAKAKRTPYLFLENVKGLLNHEKGKTFTKILQTLEELGYEYQWMVLNSKFFGVPQNRERVFIIANLRGKPRPEILPFRENATEVSELYYETQDSQPEIGQAKRRYGIKGISPPLQNWSPLIMTLERKEFREHKSEGTPTLKNRMGTGGNNVPMVMNPKLRDYTIKAITNVTKSRDSKVLDPEGISHTLTAGRDGGCTNMRPTIYTKERNVINGVRRLTPKECERLQGFPDDWTKGVSDTQRYKQLGNAVTVNVIQAISEKFK